MINVPRMRLRGGAENESRAVGGELVSEVRQTLVIANLADRSGLRAGQSPSKW